MMWMNVNKTFNKYLGVKKVIERMKVFIGKKEIPDYVKIREKLFNSNVKLEGAKLGIKLGRRLAKEIGKEVGKQIVCDMWYDIPDGMIGVQNK